MVCFYLRLPLCVYPSTPYQSYYTPSLCYTGFRLGGIFIISSGGRKLCLSYIQRKVYDAIPNDTIVQTLLDENIITDSQVTEYQSFSYSLSTIDSSSSASPPILSSLSPPLSPSAKHRALMDHEIVNTWFETEICPIENELLNKSLFRRSFVMNDDSVETPLAAEMTHAAKEYIEATKKVGVIPMDDDDIDLDILGISSGSKMC